MKPDFKFEEKLCKQGYDLIIGLDEAGRGPLAGPVTAAAVNFQLPIFNFQSIKQFSIFKRVNDSKLLTEKKREEIFDVLTNHPDILWGVGVVSEKVIDKINILEATKLAMEKAVRTLTLDSRLRGNDKTTYLLIDGNFKINLDIPQQSIIKGDQKVFSIAAASIIAKVTRDRLMQKMHKKYPQYGFDKHKGYGTKLHVEAIKKFSPCDIHRKTFFPVTEFYNF
jgi:ribonuclease HII